jgi:predicted permease
MIDSLRQDITYAARSLRRTPGFTAAAIVTLALGIGANTTIFSLLDAVLLKPLPVSRPNELLTLYENAPDAEPNLLPDTSGGTGQYLRFSYPRFRLLQDALGANGSMAASTLSIRFVGRVQDSPAAPIQTQLVSGRYFSTLGVEMQRGRALMDDDMRFDERANIAVISDGFWNSALGRSDQAVGQTILIKGVALTVIGIAAPGFVGARTDSVADLWVPLTLQHALGYSTNSSAYASADRLKPWIDQDTITWLNVTARIPRDTQTQSAAILRTANARGLQQLADSVEDSGERSSILAHTLAVTSFAQGFSGLRARFSDALYALAAMVAIVLLVTCANIANLLLARAAGRGRETGVRLSLGATTGRLVRQHLVESLLLATAGGAASVLAARWTSTFLVRAVFSRTGDLPPVFDLDSRVWIFTAAVSIASALGFGLAPALRAIGAGVNYGVNMNQRVSTNAAIKGMRPLVAAQLALSFAVVFGAMLLGRTLTYFARVDPGFEPDHVVTAAIDPDSSGYSREQIPALVDRVVAATNAIPGVVSSSVTTCGLMTNCSYRSRFTIEGTSGISLNNNWVAPAFFSTVGIPLLAGRDFTERDTADSPRVAIISESIARRYFPNQNPLGKRFGYDEPDTEIVGIVREARPSLHVDPTAMIYFPTRQPPQFRASPHALAVRVTGDASATVASVRAAIRRSEPGLLLDAVTTMSAAVARDVSRERLIAYLAFSFAILALLLACIGLYGVLSYTVARRTQEIGVRMALGARPGDLVRMVIGDGSRVVIAGVVLGVLAAVGVGRLLRSLLAGVSASDPSTLVLVGVTLIAVSLAACYMPARRASRVNPIAALRLD